MPTNRGIHLRATGSAKCCLCGVLIGSDKTPENEVWPLDLDVTFKKYRWSHFTCAVASVGGDPAALQAPVCKHWATVGRCSYRDSCMFQHPLDTLQKLQGSQRVALEDNGRRRNRGDNKRNRVLKQSRSFVFRRFLHDTFGLDLLRSGSGVIDVAGGKGELSFELQNLSEVPTTTLDPRIANLRQFYSKWDRGFYGRNTFWAEYSPGFRADRKPVAPAEARIFLEKPLVDYCLELHSDRSARPETEEAATSWFSDARKRADEVLTYDEEIADKMRQLTLVRDRERERERERDCGAAPWPADSARGGDDPRELAPEPPQTAPDTHMQRAEPTPASKPSSKSDTGHGKERAQSDAENGDACREVGAAGLHAIASRLLAASVLVGMHPDQATEPLVDFCLGSGKPFAVVPCCVFATLFPGRRFRPPPRRPQPPAPSASAPDVMHDARREGLGAVQGTAVACLDQDDGTEISGCEGWSERALKDGDGEADGAHGAASTRADAEEGVESGSGPAEDAESERGGEEGKVAVKTYADFVEYLLQKDSRICKATLDFEGRNTVLYFNPQAS